MQTDDLLASTLRELAAAIARHLPRGTVSRAAASTLSVLDREGPQRITALAEREAVSQPAMTNLVQRLEAQRLVERAADPLDARATLARLSPEEHDALVAALPALSHVTELHESR